MRRLKKHNVQSVRDPKFVSQLAYAYLRNVRFRTSFATQARYDYVINRFVRTFGTWQWRKLRREDFLRYFDMIGKELGPAALRLSVTVIRCMFTWADYSYVGLVDFPKHYLKYVAKPPVRVKYLKLEQLHNLARICNDYRPGLGTIVMLAATSGMRQKEIKSIKMMNVKWTAPHEILIHDTKNGDSRVVPVKPEVMKLLAKYRKPVFDELTPLFPPKLFVRLPYIMKSAVKKAGIHEAFTFHDLRHHAASMLVQNGVDLYVVGTILGHRDFKTTQRYAHLNTRNLHDALSKVPTKI